MRAERFSIPNFVFIFWPIKQEGVTAAESYGLKLAESVRFPPSIVPKAKLIYRDLKTREERENIVRCIGYDIDRALTISYCRLFNEMVNANALHWQIVLPHYE